MAVGAATLSIIVLAACGGGGGTSGAAPTGAAATQSSAPGPGSEAQGMPLIAGVQAKLGGEWGRVNELPHTQCLLPGETEPTSGMNTQFTTSAQQVRSDGDAERAARDAAGVVRDHWGLDPQVEGAGGTWTATATKPDSGELVIVTVDGQMSTATYGTQCIPTSEGSA